VALCCIFQEFAPDIVLVSAGFDAAAGHAAPLGGYKVSPACFGHMTQQLLKLADGKVILSLEGGYDLPSICDSAQECVRALLGDEPSPLREEELRRLPCQNAIDTLQKTIAIQVSLKQIHSSGALLCVSTIFNAIQCSNHTSDK
jgi:histone deacetylase 4/5